jgi:hypothetical protein
MESSSHTFESVWAAMQESNRFLTEKLAETDRVLSEKLDRVAEQQADTDRLVKANAVQINGISKNNGAAAEEYFYNALQYGNKKLFGENFDDVFRGEKRKTIKGYEDEYDIMLFNCGAVCVVEVKYKADSADVLQVLRKERTFRANFPEHSKKKLYLAMASMSFHPLTEKACSDNGIAVMKQVGNTLVVSDENLKVF